jgi:CheY-like chemotaxis protein
MEEGLGYCKGMLCSHRMGEAAEDAGFRLAEESRISANPKDTYDDTEGLDAATNVPANGSRSREIDCDRGKRPTDDEVRESALIDLRWRTQRRRRRPHFHATTRPTPVMTFLMPGMNGAELARLAQVQRLGLPIVSVSGYSDMVALDDIIGAVVVRKPFDMIALGFRLIQSQNAIAVARATPERKLAASLS